MVSTWQIISTTIIVGLSIVIPIYYSYQKKKKTIQEAKPLINMQIKKYINKINEETRNKNR